MGDVEEQISDEGCIEGLNKAMTLKIERWKIRERLKHLLIVIKKYL